MIDTTKGAWIDHIIEKITILIFLQGDELEFMFVWTMKLGERKMGNGNSIIRIY